MIGRAIVRCVLLATISVRVVLLSYCWCILSLILCYRILATIHITNTDNGLCVKCDTTGDMNKTSRIGSFLSSQCMCPPESWSMGDLPNSPCCNSTGGNSCFRDGHSCKIDSDCSSGKCAGQRCCGNKGKTPGCDTCDDDGNCAYCGAGYFLETWSYDSNYKECKKCGAECGYSCNYQADSPAGSVSQMQCTGPAICPNCHPADSHDFYRANVAPGGTCGADSECSSGVCRGYTCCDTSISPLANLTGCGKCGYADGLCRYCKQDFHGTGLAYHPCVPCCKGKTNAPYPAGVGSGGSTCDGTCDLPTLCYETLIPLILNGNSYPNWLSCGCFIGDSTNMCYFNCQNGGSCKNCQQLQYTPGYDEICIITGTKTAGETCNSHTDCLSGSCKSYPNRRCCDLAYDSKDCDTCDASGHCAECKKNNYLNNGVCVSCPEGKTSIAGSVQSSDCKGKSHGDACDKNVECESGNKMS